LDLKNITYNGKEITCGNIRLAKGLRKVDSRFTGEKRKGPVLRLISAPEHQKELGKKVFHQGENIRQADSPQSQKTLKRKSRGAWTHLCKTQMRALLLKREGRQIAKVNIRDKLA